MGGSSGAAAVATTWPSAARWRSRSPPRRSDCTVDAPWALWALAGGLVLFGVVAAIQLWRFTRLNGVRVGGFASQGRVRDGGHGVPRRRPCRSSLAYAAAVRELWWLVALVSVAGGVVYVLSGRRWLRAYRQEPARLGAGESTLWLALAVGLAVAGLVLLVLQR